MVALALLSPTLSSAANVTSAVIFGNSGNANGSFTVTTAGGLEIGLRAKQRFPSPAGIYNYNGVDTYTFPAGAATSGAGWIDSNTPVWNFEWSINSNWNGTGVNIGNYAAYLSLDVNPGFGATTYQTFEFLQGPDHHFPANANWDHSFGTNSTLDNAGSEASDLSEYLNLIANNNLVQNSWNYEFFDSASGFFNLAGQPLEGFLPVNGEYTIKLEVFDSVGGTLLGSNSINVVMIPEPSLAIGGLLCLAGLGIRRRSR
jgi:hypothetical protein